MTSSATVSERSSERLLRLIFDHAARISRAQEIPDLIRSNADFARDLVGADRCSLWLSDEKSGELWTIVAHQMEAIRIPVGQGLVGACVRKGEVVLANNVALDARFLSSIDAGSGYQTKEVLCVPIQGDGRGDRRAAVIEQGRRLCAGRRKPGGVNGSLRIQRD